MSSATSDVTYTSVYSDSEPGRAFWGTDYEEVSEGDIPRVIVLGYDGLPLQPVAPPSPDYILGPQILPVPQDEDEREPMFIQAHDPDYVPEPIYPEYIPLEDDHEFPAEEQPLPPIDSPTTDSPGYVTESDPEEDPEEYEDDKTEDGPVDYPMDGGDDGDDGDDDDGDSSGDDARDEDEDEEDDEDEEEEEEHLAPADSTVVPADGPVSPPEGTEPVIPPPSTDITIGARITIRPQTSISLPPEAEVERLLAMTTPSPSPPISLSPPSAGERLARCMAPPAHSPPLPPSSGCLTQIQTLRIASTQALIDAVTAALPPPPLPPLPPSLYIPPPVDRRDDIPESEQPPRKRLHLSTICSRYEIGESSTARPVRGQGIDYGFISTVDAEERRQGIRDVGYGIRDTWVDPAESTVGRSWQRRPYGDGDGIWIGVSGTRDPNQDASDTQFNNVGIMIASRPEDLGSASHETEPAWGALGTQMGYGSFYKSSLLLYCSIQEGNLVLSIGAEQFWMALKAQQLEPKLYDGNVINNTSAIVIPDFEETLMLAEERHFETRFVPQTELSAEQAFWSQNSMNSTEPTLSSRPTKVEVPKELPKVSMVNTSLKKLKHNLAGFNVVVKERTTPTTITKGSWGFEHTKAYFRDEIIPFAVEQHRLESKTFEVKMNQVLNENERLLEQVISKDIVNTIVNSSVDIASVNVHECEKCLKLETELLNKKDFEIFQRDNSVSNQSAPSFDQLFELDELKAQSQEKDMTYKQLYDSTKPTRIRSKEQCDDLINQVNLKSVEISDLNASLQEKVLEITAPKDYLRKLKGKALVDNAVIKHTIDPEMLNIDVEPITPKLLNKRTAHSAYIKHTQEEAAVLRDLVDHVKANYPLDHSLESSCRPTGRTFTIVGNACPLTRITTTTEVPLRKPTALENETPTPVVTLVYSQKPRKSQTNVPVSKPKVVQIVLWYLDSGCSKHMTGDRSQLTNFVNKFLGTIKFGNNHMAKILGYGDYQIGNVTISRVYYVEGLGHNLFSVGQFCDSNLEVAFRQHTCFIRNLEGVDLLTGSRGNNLYTLSLGDMMASSLICLLSKATKTKSWLWHRRLSHLNFAAINHLARHGLVRGLPKLKFEKNHLCSACAMGKSKKKPHKPESKNTNQEKLYLLHMDLYGPIRVASINRKKHILVIVDDYS
ncbi:retrovirus-related pol polyprotein from transposon TNT 1-94 [Tanacetum coccineum]